VKLKLKFVLYVLITTIWAVIFLGGLSSYNESKALYSLFSIVYLLLLISGVFRVTSYSYFFLAIFLWLGVWLKLTVHLILQYPYAEAVGRFYTSNTSMDDVLIVSIVGALGFLLSGVLYRKLKFKKTTAFIESYNLKEYIAFSWLQRYKILLLATITLSSLLIGYFNVKFGIHQIGLAPKTYLSYPLNAIIAWLLNLGFFLIYATYVTWNIKFNGKIQLRLFIPYVFISAIISISILSRGQFVYMVGAAIVFLLLNYNFDRKGNIIKGLSFLLFVGATFFVIIIAVTSLRTIYFSEQLLSVSSSMNQGGVSSLIHQASANSSVNQAYSVFLQLLIDRWIGIEGIMATVSYPEKSFELFFNSFTATPRIGTIDVYQHISNSQYQNVDTTKYMFGTLPGVIGYFYYSGSLIFLLFGTFIISSAMLFLEYIVRLVSESSLVAAILGMYFACFVSQMGGTSINFLKSLVFITFFLLFAKFLELFFKKRDARYDETK